MLHLPPMLTYGCETWTMYRMIMKKFTEEDELLVTNYLIIITLLGKHLLELGGNNAIIGKYAAFRFQIFLLLK